MPRPSASSRELSAFGEDARYHLERSGLVRVDRVLKTGNKNNALEIHCSASGCPDAVASELERVWTEAPLGYGGTGDSFAVDVSGETVVATFVADGGANLRVTGRLLVEVTAL